MSLTEKLRLRFASITWTDSMQVRFSLWAGLTSQVPAMAMA
jgi:hypothetical protein